jgi:hypothetical protein
MAAEGAGWLRCRWRKGAWCGGAGSILLFCVGNCGQGGGGAEVHRENPAPALLVSTMA